MIRSVIVISTIVALSSATDLAVWSGETVQDLHNEYYNIFKFGNRNAASHLWSTFLIDRSSQMTNEKLELMFTGYCAISGSPVRPSDYNRYKLSLELAAGHGEKRTGYLHYCCWPCVCDTQDFIKVDTKTVALRNGSERKYHFAVIGNPCDRPEALDVPFVQPFGFRQTTIRREAREVRCGPNGELLGATLSDNGFVIIGMFFDLAESQSQDPEASGVGLTNLVAQPGRVSDLGGVLVQDEFEFGPMCEDRARQGYNSGMGEIFRRVASVSAIDVRQNILPTA